MAIGNEVFQRKTGTGWSRGLSNLMSAELGHWFRTKKWWVQIVTWAAIINFILLMVALEPEGDAVTEIVMLFNIFLGMFAAVGVCVMMQGSLVGEKQSGTAAWVLSKPVSRPAVVLAKLVANTIGIAVTIVLAQGLIAYLIIYLTTGTALPWSGYLAGLAIHLVNLWFFTTLTLMLGAFFSKRGPVIAIPLVFLFSQQFLFGLVPELLKVLPWTLTVPLDDDSFPSLAMALMTNLEPFSYQPLFIALGAAVLFVLVAMWALERQEF